MTAEQREPGDARASRITTGTRLLHGDLHNHSLLSDGAGNPERAFAMMRDAGLDVAALTDHASIPHHALAGLDQEHYPDAAALRLARSAPVSLDEAAWKRTGELADTADVPGSFTAIRGFEWTEPWLGHANVWFSEGWLHVDTPGRLHGLHEWLLAREPGALLGYNHPGREPGRLGGFALHPGLVGRMVGLEMFNRSDDYLFEGHTAGHPSPLVASLDAGWRPGLIGVSDEHGARYGVTGRGRTGIWAAEHSRGGVREALESRRTFATREVGLRLDATLGGARMGSVLPAAGGPLELLVDLGLSGDLTGDPSGRAAGLTPSTTEGRRLELQLLGRGDGTLPALLASAPAVVGEVTRLEINPRDEPWFVLRVADSARQPEYGPAGHPATAYGVAYASPWWAGSLTS